MAIYLIIASVIGGIRAFIYTKYTIIPNRDIMLTSQFIASIILAFVISTAAAPLVVYEGITFCIKIYNIRKKRGINK